MPAEAVAIAARDAAPTLQFTHSFLRRPGGGKGRKKGGAAAAAQDGVAAGDAAQGPIDQGAPSAGAAAPQVSPAFRQLTRLTFAAAEAGQAQLLAQRTDVTSAYDIVAVQPLSDRVLQQVRQRDRMLSCRNYACPE